MSAERFQSLSQALYKYLTPKQHLFVEFSGETSQFLRFNQAKIRQSGSVEDANIELTLLEETSQGLKKATSDITIDWEQKELAQTVYESALKPLQKILPDLPVDPYAELPQGNETSHQVQKGQLPDHQIETLLPELRGLDLAGIWATGPIQRGMAHSGGLFHWFQTETFTLDYSIYSGERAVKGCYGGTHFKLEDLRANIQKNRQKLSYMERPPVSIARGKHRAFLESDAVKEIIHTLSWGVFSEAGLRRSGSPALKIRSGEHPLSKKFSLCEDFAGGEFPRFNERGQLAPLQTVIVEEGRLKNTLVSQRTAKEYGLAFNGADEQEVLRSPVIAEGDLANESTLTALGEGLYLSNLHYLNWSDFPGGRITGMTRFACFWVKNGQIQAPIENLRFDDTLFRILGSELEAVTRTVEPHIETTTYGMRQPGVIKTPGFLLKSMQFTL